MPQLQSATILIAEDEPASRRLLATCLRQAGYQTLEAASGEEALRLAAEKSPDLAILDIMMPGMKGTEAAERLRRDTGVPFIFLSALDESDIVQQAVEAGALGYLVKPLNVPQLAPAIRAALERAEELRRLRAAESNLAAALAVGRSTSIAIGILMERHGLSQQQAFDLLKSSARASRRKVVELADQLVQAMETLNALSPDKH